jgi:hypothetical protein
MQKITFLMLACLLGVSSLAQTLENRLSASKVAALVSLNAQNYKSKGKFQTLLDLDFIKKIDEDTKKRFPKEYKTISAIYKNPEEAGINAYPRSYIFISTLDSNAVMVGAIFSLADAKKFERWANTAWKDEQDVQKAQTDGYTSLTRNDGVIAWNNTCGVIAAVQISDRNFYGDINYDDPDYDRKLQEKEQQSKIKKQEFIRTEITQMLKGNVANPIAENDNFKIFLAKPYDLGIWLNYEQFSGSINNMLKEIPEIKFGAAERFASRLKSYYKDYYDHILFTTNKGNATVTYQTYLSEKMYKIFGNAFNTRINPDFYKYVEGDKLMGIYAVSGDLKVLGNGLLELYRNFGEDLSKEGQMIAASMDAMGVILDEDAILSVMKGDFMIAFTGVKEIEVQYIDYQYDGDIYLGPVTKTRKENSAIYVMTLTIGNKDNFEKFLKLFTTFGGFVMQNGYYEIKDAGKVQNYLAIDKDILVISNDLELIKQVGSLKLKKPVEARIQKLTQDNPMLVYVNTQNVVDAILTNSKNISAEERKDLLETKKDLGEFQMVGPNMRDKTFFSEGVLQMNDKKNNSLAPLVRFFNRFVKDRSGNFESPEAVTEGGKKNKKKKKKEH